MWPYHIAIHLYMAIFYSVYWHVHWQPLLLMRTIRHNVQIRYEAVFDIIAKCPSDMAKWSICNVYMCVCVGARSSRSTTQKRNYKSFDFFSIRSLFLGDGRYIRIPNRSNFLRTVNLLLVYVYEAPLPSAFARNRTQIWRILLQNRHILSDLSVNVSVFCLSVYVIGEGMALEYGWFWNDAHEDFNIFNYDAFVCGLQYERWAVRWENDYAKSSTSILWNANLSVSLSNGWMRKMVVKVRLISSFTSHTHTNTHIQRAAGST